MSGVIIDVDTRAESSKKDLESLNRSLASLVTGAGRAKGSLNGIRAQGLGNLNKDVARSTAAMSRLGTTGQASMNQIAQGVKSVTRDVSLLKGAVFASAAAFAAFKTIGSLNTMSDDLTNVQNRLRLVTNGTYELMQAQREMLRLSNDTRSSIQGTTSLYVAFANSMSKAGVSQDRLVAGVRVIQQAAAISNMGVESTNAAITQLNQGLSSGTLRGEELNSVLEQLPYLGQQIARELKMTTGQMREFAAEGKLSTDIVFRALEGMAARTDVAFRQTNASVAQGRAAFKQTIAYNIADLNAYFGVSASFARGLTTNADRFEGASDRMITRLNLVKTSLSNYLKELENTDAFASTLKAALRFEFNPLSTADKTDQGKRIRAYVKQMQGLVDRGAQVEIEANPSGLSKIFGRQRAPRSEIEDAATSANKVRENVKNVVNLTAALYDTLRTTVLNTLHLMPKLYAPLISYADQLRKFVSYSRIDISSWIADTVRPATRGIESLNETLSFFGSGDKRVERAWVNLFKADSLADFNDKLFKLNRAREALKLDDKSFMGRVFLFRLDRANDSVEEFLMRMGLMKSKFKITIPTDEIVSKFKTMGSVIARIYADILAPKLDPVIRKLGVQIAIGRRTLLAGLRDTFTENVGSRLGRKVADGFTRGVSAVFDSWEGFENLDFGEVVAKAVDDIANVISGPLARLRNFVKGFFSGLFKDVFKGVNADPLREMFDSIEQTAKTRLRSVEQRITSFGEHINNVFFNIWDKVIGHSYWPDMIDGVVDYTKRLFSAQTTVQSFGESVKRIFKRVLSSVAELGRNSGGIFGEVIDKLSNVDWTDALKKLSTNISGAMLAGVFFAFGSPRMKFAAISYLLSIFNVALDNTLGVIGPGLAAAAGTIGGEFAGHLAEGFVRSLGLVVNAIPAFIESFVSALLAGVPVIGDVVKGMFSIFPLVSNNLVLMAAGLAGLSAVLFKDTRKSIVNAIFGSPARIRKDGTVMAASVMGLLPIMQSMMFGWLPSIGGGFIDKLFGVFRDKRFVVAGALALSSMLLESVTMLEAFQVGIPLLGLAILGPKGGMRFVRDFSGIIIPVIRTLANLATGAVTRYAPNSLLDKLFSSGLGTKGLKGRIQNGFGQAGPIRNAFGALLGTLMAIPGNLARNGDAYGAGKLSLAAAMLSSLDAGPAGFIGPMQQKVAPIRKQFSDLMNGLLDFKPDGNSGNTLRNTYGAVFTQLLASFTSFKLRMSDPSGWNKVTETISSVFQTMARTVRRSFSLMADGFTGFIGLLRNKFVLIVLFFGLFATAARAATDAGGAISELTTSVGGLVSMLITAVVALKAIGVGMRALKAFKAGKEAFNLANPRAGGTGSTVAGLASASNYIGSIGARVVNKGRSLVGGLTSTARRRPDASPTGNSNNIGSSFLGAGFAAAELKDSINDLGKSPSFSKLNDTFKSVGKTGVHTFKGIGGAATTMFTVVRGGGGLLGALTGAIATTASVGVAGFTALGAAIWTATLPLLPIIGAIVAAVAVVGVLGVMLFGKGDSFLDKLQWAYDKIRAILGLSQVTDQGRRSAIADSLKDVTVAGVKLDFTSVIERVDFESMSADMFGTVKAQAEETAKAIAEIAEAERRQGYYTLKQKEDLLKLQSDQDALLGRQNQRPVTSLTEKGESIRAELSVVDNSLDTRVNRMLGGPNNESINGITAVGRTVENGITASLDEFFKRAGAVIDAPRRITVATARVGGAMYTTGLRETRQLYDNTRARVGSTIDRAFGGRGQSERQLTAGNNIRRSVARVAPFEANLNPAQLESYNVALLKYRDAQMEANKLEQTRYKGERLADGSTETRIQYEERKAAAIRNAVETTRVLAVETQKAEDAGVKAVSVKSFQKNIKESSSNIKDMLGVDIGETGHEWFGDNTDLEFLRNSAALVSEINAEIMQTNDAGRLAVLNAEKAALAAVAQAEAARITAQSAFETNNEFLAGVSGDSAQSVAAMFRIDPANFAVYDDLAGQLDRVNAQIKAVPPNSEGARETLERLEGQASALRKELTEFSPDALSLEDINAKFQSMNIPEINLDKYVYMTPGHIRGLQDNFNAVEVASEEVQEALRKLGSDDASLNNYIDKLRKLRDELRKARAEAAVGTTTAIAAAMGENSENPTLAGLEVGLLTGDMAPANVLGNPRAITRRNSAVLARSNAQAILEQAIASSRDLSAAAREVARQDEIISNIDAPPGAKDSGGTPRMFTDILSRLSEVGIAVDAVNFTRLGEEARVSLTSIGVDLDIIAKRIEKARPGANLTALLAERAKLFDEARIKLLDALYNTGRGIAEGFSRMGVTDNAALARLNPTDASGLLALDRESESLRLQREQVSTQEEFFAITRKMADLDRERLAYAARLDKTLEEQVSTVNDVFNAALEAADVRFLGADMIEQLSGVAAGLQIELQKAIDGIGSRLGNSLEEAFTTFAAIQRRGQLVGLFREFENGLAEALGRGARTGFERISQQVEGIEFDDYLQLDRDTRQRLTQEEVAEESLANIFDSGALNDAMIEFLDANFINGDMSASDTIRGLEAIPGFNDDVMSLFVTPMEALNTTTRDLVEAMLDNNALLQGDEVERLDAPTVNGVNELSDVLINGVLTRLPTPNPVLAPGTTREFNERGANDALGRRRRNRNAGGLIASAVGPDQRRLAIGLGQIPGTQMDPETINRATRAQLGQMSQMGGELAYYIEQMRLAQKGVETALTIPELQSRIDDMRESFEDLGGYIEAAARRMSEAGRTLSDDVRNNLVDSVKAFAKGDMSLNDVVGSFLDTLTASIVDRFVEGLMDPLTGEGGLLDRLLRGLGEAIFGAGQFAGGKRGGLEGATSGLGAALGGVPGLGGLMGQPKPVAQPLVNLGNKFIESTSQLTGGVKLPMEGLTAGIDTNVPLLTKALTNISPSGDGGGIGGWLGSIFGGGGGGKGGGGGGLGSLFSGGAGMWGALGGIFGTLIGGLFADGGLIGGHGTGRSDSMLIGASKGEFMINAAATRRHYPLIKAINSGKLSKMVPQFADGGLISPALIAAMPMSTMDAAAREVAPKQGNSSTVNIAITGDISRQTRAEMYRMLPDITNGVNAVNREQGNR